MDIKALKILFDDKSLISVEAVRAPLEKGWILHFERRNGAITMIGTTREPEKAKIFRSLDAAASAVSEIGFVDFKIRLKEVVADVEAPKHFKLKG
jgi:hypothetical protein